MRYIKQFTKVGVIHSNNSKSILKLALKSGIEDNSLGTHIAFHRKLGSKVSQEVGTYIFYTLPVSKPCSDRPAPIILLPLAGLIFRTFSKITPLSLEL